MLLRILSNIVRSLGNVCEIILFLTRGDVDDDDDDDDDDDAAPVLHHLHWLPVSFRFNFKILLLTFKAIHELALYHSSC